MKIIFFGLGSIGKRHARLLARHFDYPLYAFRSGEKPEANNMGIKELFTWKEVKKASPDIAFITNPTYLHIKTAIKCAKLGMNLFIEKPIDKGLSNLNQLLDIVRSKKLSTYVAYCLRFHPVIEEIKRESGRGKKHVRVTVSSYLPDWRKEADYTANYSSDKRKGGGVILELSHEIDYISYLFGEIKQIEGLYGKISDLSIKCEDYADILIKTGNATVNLHLNFFSKNTERSIEIDFENSDFIKADLINNSLLINRKGRKKNYKYRIGRDDIYVKQLKYFFKNLSNRKMMNNIFSASKVFTKIINFKGEQ